MMTEEAGEVKRQMLITHGVDLETFVAAGQSKAAGPADVATLRRPRAGFIGGIDAHTFDPKLLIDTARRMQNVEFVLIGGCSLPDGWCTLPNVKMLGRKSYDMIASYMAAMDVLIMPWNDSEWIKACNPIKLKEYLAVGKPVVTTDFPALDSYRDLVRTAANAHDFANGMRQALGVPYDPEAARLRLAGEGWDDKTAYLAEGLADLVYELESAKADACRPKLTAA